MKIRMLTQEDLNIWKQFRLEALQNSPESFESSYEEELNWSDSDFQDTLDKNTIFGAFVNHTLATCAAFYSLNSLKTKHRGVIWGMYRNVYAITLTTSAQIVVSLLRSDLRKSAGVVVLH
jgi:hypothetical protein